MRRSSIRSSKGNLATVGELKAELGGVLDEDTVKSTLAELFDDCWIEVVR